MKLKKKGIELKYNKGTYDLYVDGKFIIKTTDYELVFDKAKEFLKNEENENSINMEVW